MRLLRFLLTCVCTFQILSVHAQTLTQTIKGTVIDISSEIPLPYASVQIIDSTRQYATITNEEGVFRLEKVPPGRYNIKVSYIGYDILIVNEVLVTSGKEVILDLRLKESVIRLDEVIIKAQLRKDQSLNKMATLSARTFSVEEARRYASGVDDPSRIATAFAGVAATSFDDNGLIIRGNSPKGVLWRLEGVEIPNPNHLADIYALGGSFTVFSSQMLANSDFFTGAFPAEYGNALSGVFDIRLRKGNPESREHVIQAGAIGMDISSEGPFKKGHHSSYLFNYRYSTLALLKKVFPPHIAIPTFQDICFNLHLNGEKYGQFNLWGVGGISKASKKANDDRDEWAVDWDKFELESESDMGAAGITHKLFLNDKSYMNHTAFSTVKYLSYTGNEYDDSMNYIPVNHRDYAIYKYGISGFINTKFSARYTSKSGYILSRYYFNYDVKWNIFNDNTLHTISSQSGNTTLLQLFSQSRFDVTENFYLNGGVHSQLFFLNHEVTFEPRLGMHWQFIPCHSVSLGYGLHSMIEPLNIYFIEFERSTGEIILPNTSLKSTKSHHVVLGYDWNINEVTRLKIEPYYQYLYDIPVIPDSSFSMVNYYSEFDLKDTLRNQGTGTNYGIDITIERFLDNNYYYLLTASFFDSKFRGGDNLYRNTRYNKNFVINLLAGKEWFIDRNSKNNVIGVNARVSLCGGNPIVPVMENESLEKEEIILDYSRLYSQKSATKMYFDISILFRFNKTKYSSMLAIQAKNIFGAKEFFGYDYNFKNHTIQKNELVFIIPSVSYKIEF
ncbi:MAG: hypothetical protein AMS27_13695 [Bacteroides sp. SM23_62_1]|nr:MAG: hypothetical protein AMS27_13695 [Bacteroides sp. SM23_62_1]